MKWHAKNTGTEWKCFVGMHAELVKAAKAHREAQTSGKRFGTVVWASLHRSDRLGSSGRHIQSSVGFDRASQSTSHVTHNPENC
jgi:hypothetical protein